ncbi:MAG: tryptophan-rich sensory protein [Bacilli bacterium]|nr:tryptophan-rich sensory protein [Bacilli bacterium]
MLRKIIFFLILILFWNITLILFPVNYAYITTLQGIININYKYFIIMYFLLTLINNYVFYKLFTGFDLNNNYNFVYILNYIFTQVFGLFFFKFNCLILSVICLCIVFVSSIFVYLESKKIDRTNSYLIIPSILFNMFNLIGLMIVMILN